MNDYQLENHRNIPMEHCSRIGPTAINKANSQDNNCQIDRNVIPSAFQYRAGILHDSTHSLFFSHAKL